MGSATCASRSFDGGKLSCTAGCTFDETGCFKCGDKKKNGAEQCDAADMGSATCKSQNFIGGTLTCGNACKLDTSKCHNCGNAKINGSEQCDGANLNNATCKSLKYFQGTLSCKADCTFDTSKCTNAGCGNGKLDSGETCDGANLNSKQCLSIPPYHSGTLKCAAGCKAFDTTGCNKCGDGKVNGSEKCDGAALGLSSCKTLNFAGGTLKCAAGCAAFDTTGCHRCGDNKINGGEECDGTALGSKTCADHAYLGGQLKCSSACKYDKNSCVGFKWITVKAGTFSMGAPGGEKCRQSNETQHKVTLSNDFEIANVEVTQGQYKAQLGASPSKFASCGSGCPVEQVTWHDAAAYSNKLSAAKGLMPCYRCAVVSGKNSCSVDPEFSGKKIYDCPGYRLPTDAEWEYAYRAGTTTGLHNGAISNCTTDTSAGLIGWYKANAASKTHPVAGKLANAWGLYDMAGNVWEWTNDWYQADLGSATVTDPAGPSTGTKRVFRGGAWSDTALHLRAALRNNDAPTFVSNIYGFRPARTLNPPLVAYWKLDQGSGTQAKDATGNGHHGTVKNGALRRAGRVGKGLVLDGVDDRVELAEPYAIDSKAVTITAWIKTAGMSQVSMIVSNGYTSAVNHFELGVNSTGQVLLSQDISGKGTVLRSMSRVNTGQWVFVAWTRTAAGVDTLYVNGLPSASHTNAGDISDKKSWSIGCIQSAGANCFNGAIDEVRLYSRALSAADVKALHGAAPFCDDKLKNGAETDVDCGGPLCRKCADTYKCSAASDCLSGACTAGACAAGCTHQAVSKSCGKDGLGHSWCAVPAGCYSMGSTKTTDPCRDNNEDQRKVTLTHSFEVASTETTQEHYKTVMGTLPTQLGCTTAATCPVGGVRWDNGAAFCNALSARRGLPSCYRCSGAGGSQSCELRSRFAGDAVFGCAGFRLPTEAEWEYAYRAGTTTSLHNGKSVTSCGNMTNNDLGAIGWYYSNSGSGYPAHNVGQKTANAWGLFDMSGNVWEWAEDAYRGSLGLVAAVNAHTGSASSNKVCRGGSSGSSPDHARGATRLSRVRTQTNATFGFRCVRTLAPANRCVDLAHDYEGGKFSGYTVNNWGVHTGNVAWTPTSGGVKYTGGSSSGGGNSVVAIGDPGWTDYSVEADVKPLSTTTSGNWLGVVGRFQSTSKMYGLYLTGTGSVHLIHGSTGLATRTITVTVGQVYRLRLEMQGALIKGYVNGKLMLEAAHSGSAAGKAGLVAASGSTQFDNFRVIGCGGFSVFDDMEDNVINTEKWTKVQDYNSEHGTSPSGFKETGGAIGTSSNSYTGSDTAYMRFNTYNSKTSKPSFDFRQARTILVDSHIYLHFQSASGTAYGRYYLIDQSGNKVLFHEFARGSGYTHEYGQVRVQRASASATSAKVYFDGALERTVSTKTLKATDKWSLEFYGYISGSGGTQAFALQIRDIRYTL